METRQFIALFAVIAVAAAGCIGAAYAFSAALDNDNNSAGVEYWKLSVTASSNGIDAAADSEGKLYTGAFIAPVPFDTKTVLEKNLDTQKYDQVVQIKGVSDVNKVLATNIAPLGWLSFSIADQDGNAVPAPTDTQDDKKYYPFTISIADELTYNEKYDLYAALCTIDTVQDQKVIKYADITEAVLFQKVDGKYTATLVGLPEKDSNDTKVIDGFSVAIFAAPHVSAKLSDLEKASFKSAGESAAGHKYAQTDVLQDAVFEFAVSSVETAEPTIGSIVIAKNPDTTRFHGVPAISTKEERASVLGGMVLQAVYTDGTKRLVDFTDTTDTTGVNAVVNETEQKITFTYSGMSADLTIVTYYNVQLMTDKVSGSLYQLQEVVYNGAATQPATNPSKPGYEFNQWQYTNTQSQDVQYDFTTPVKADVVIFATWTPANNP